METKLQDKEGTFVIMLMGKPATDVLCGDVLTPPKIKLAGREILIYGISRGGPTFILTQRCLLSERVRARERVLSLNLR